MTTPADLITIVRVEYNDSDSDLYRHQDSTLIQFFNEGVKELSVLRPDLFSVLADFTCTVSTVEQTIAFTDAQQLLEVVSIKNGAALTVFDMKAMDAFNPGWRTDTAGAATQWARLQGDPLKFFIYPKAPATTQTLSIRYVKNPTVLTTTDTITEVPVGLFPALVDYMIYRLESVDDEHVLSQRAQAAYAGFVAKAKGVTQ